MSPQFPFPPFPIWPGIGEGIPDSRFGRNRETGNPPIPDSAGNGGPDSAVRGRGFPVLLGSVGLSKSQWETWEVRAQCRWEVRVGSMPAGGEGPVAWLSSKNRATSRTGSFLSFSESRSELGQADYCYRPTVTKLQAQAAAGSSSPKLNSTPGRTAVRGSPLGPRCSQLQANATPEWELYIFKSVH